ncbi:hypothetical protein MMC07_006807 [Pseudocyphellaria aurata]|nr:hypothetical protein [Pseudocyphellaria aurata]
MSSPLAEPDLSSLSLANSLLPQDPILLPASENTSSLPINTSSPLPPHLSHSPLDNQKVSAPFQFGSRHLLPTSSVYEFNAWDHVPPPPAELARADAQYAAQRAHPVSAFDAARFNADPVRWWNRFYTNNTANFFKDRKWLRQEFPVLTELTAVDQKEEGNEKEEQEEQKTRETTASILEVGAGAGNTAFPLLKANRNPRLMIHACDFSAKAVDLLRASPEYDERHMRASVWDMSGDDLPPGVQPSSIDVVLLIFVFSALSPRQWARAVRNVHEVLKPGGEVCFRDYGRGDLAQVRFRKGRWMEENFYVRGDGTRVYFFDEDELRRLWSGETRGDDESGQDSDAISKEAQRGAPEKVLNPAPCENAQQNPPTESPISAPAPSPNARPGCPKFEIVSLGTDRRLLVNRQKQLQMHRCWLQGRFRKPLLPAAAAAGDDSRNQ